ncbi:MaoC family dehydratase [Glaciimonas sp. Gout2]|uniref:MaoC family dehydratase n=1 Tax=unclassified Glaciimonas TaxID=2644401 RepID=UPI002B23856F|nr:MULTISPECIES: MaoC family dehydratase [unclassified Glaciimonas]MEB0012356.1 MaoC family dehydratase [Glaciimonas sp. Cout2]MEB0080458.1 MaoC family dehydratase [Glaciimonas sp. Gout2]
MSESIIPQSTILQPDIGTLALLRTHIGSEIFVSDWVLMSQSRINQFAEATGDFQWIHVDVARAKKESPFGCTIAHGFLTLSLLGKFYQDNFELPFCEMGINYGLNKVRFTNPVRVDSRVRGRFLLSSVADIPGGIQIVLTATIEIEGDAKPACIAESVVRQYFTKT